MTRLHVVAVLSVLAVSPAQIRAQSAHTDIPKGLGWPSVPESGTEVRIWLESNALVSELYRVVKVDQDVKVYRYAFSRVIHPAENGYSVTEARHETQYSRKLLKKEQCSGELATTADFLWCQIALQQHASWQLLFEDLLPDELWKLPPQVSQSCGDVVIVDGETITIEMLERGRTHVVSYSNPDTCCGTVACAIADHVRSVIRNVY